MKFDSPDLDRLIKDGELYSYEMYNPSLDDNMRTLLDAATQAKDQLQSLGNSGRIKAKKDAADKLYVLQNAIDRLAFFIYLKNNKDNFKFDLPPNLLSEMLSLDQKIADSMFSELPEGAEKRLEAVGDRIHAFHRVAAKELASSLNEYLTAQSPKEFGEKQLIVSTVSSHLNSMNLAIRYKDQPCYLSATMAGDLPTGRFLLVPIGSKTPLLARVNLSDFLPVELMDAPARDTKRAR